jgi:hypothetical protein
MKTNILSLLLASPVFLFAQETTETVAEAVKERVEAVPEVPVDPAIQKLFYFVLMFGAIAVILGVIAMSIINATTRKKWIMDSNIQHLKAQLAAKGYEPESALIRILHQQSALYKEEPKGGKAEKFVEIVEVEVEATADHSLALTVADELARINKNLSEMEESTRGLKQLKASVDRMTNNFKSNGYEIVDMLNKSYSEGMNAMANFIQSEDLPTGKQVITRIIKPQVNFQGKMIQAAQIEVSVGE